MAEPIDSIEARLEALLLAGPVRAVHPVELPDVGEVPAITLLFAGPGQEDGATGGITDNEWRWLARIYVSVKDPRAGQQEMKDIVPAVLAALRADPTLAGACDRLVIRDRGDPQVLRNQATLVKTLELIAETEEV